MVFCYIYYLCNLRLFLSINPHSTRTRTMRTLQSWYSWSWTRPGVISRTMRRNRRCSNQGEALKQKCDYIWCHHTLFHIPERFTKLKQCWTGWKLITRYRYILIVILIGKSVIPCVHIRPFPNRWKWGERGGWGWWRIEVDVAYLRKLTRDAITRV